MRKPVRYPMGSISSGTMRPELIPEFCSQLETLARQPGIVAHKTRKEHRKLVREIEARIENEREFEDSDLGIEGRADDDLADLFDALNEYSGPYFYFGSHPRDGADYGWWLSEDWEENFTRKIPARAEHIQGEGLIVSGIEEVPAWWRGEVAVISDHGNISLFAKTSRALREIWGVV